MVSCQSSELGWEVTVELPADFLSLGKGSYIALFGYNILILRTVHYKNSTNYINSVFKPTK